MTIIIEEVVEQGLIVEFEPNTKVLQVCPPDGEIAGWDGAGWYFHDESYHLHGPFSTKEESEKLEESYVRDL